MKRDYILIRVTTETKEKLKQKAKEKNISMSKYIRKLIQKDLKG